MRLIAPPLLVTAIGLLMPLAVTHAQSTATAAQREADTAWAKYIGGT